MSETSADVAEPAAPSDAVSSIEQVLAAEALAIHGDTPETKLLKAQARDQGIQDVRRNLNEDKRLDAQKKAAVMAAKKADEKTAAQKDDISKSNSKFYVGLNKLNNAAVCCSGGGIRSATFCLGVIQALANYDVSAVAPRAGGEPKHSDKDKVRNDQPAEVPPAPHTGGAKSAKAPRDHSVTPAHKVPIDDTQHSALGRFHYLSTVSGGGYIGSWLSSWRSRADFKTVVKN